MNIRMNPYYCISCSQGEDIRTLDVDANGPSEIVSLVVSHFSDRFTPLKGDSGNITSGQPFTEIVIDYCDSDKETRKTMKQSRIYNLTPDEVIGELKKLISKRP